ncbi:MAG TPA: branched-chain amino acid ABC transporter permease, partial [Thermotoga sp.]|nr:branched-chain amino acid ABC transporter permease [Thermotoga sp.]
MMGMEKKLSAKANFFLTVIFVIFVIFLLHLANVYMNAYQLKILNLMAIYGIMAVSLNLINGITGIFSLGHAGFILVGAYTAALLTLTPEQKEISFIIEPI